MKKPRISIIGLGRVGTAFLNALVDQDYPVPSVYNRSGVSESFIKSYPNTVFETGLPQNEEALGELIFLTSSDDAIPEIAANLAQIRSTFVGKFFVHCSDTLSSEILKPLQEKGAQVASFHPMRSITPKTKDFKEVWFDVEGDEAVVAMLENIADTLGSFTFRVEPEAKSLLHVSAVVASNYLVVLADLAATISAMGNIPEDKALKALSSLMQNTLNNVSELGTEEALTGPVVRGDLETIRDHMAKLEGNSEVLRIYKMLGYRALDIVKRKDEWTAAHDEIKKLLSR
ncbi:MAG TPA: hypothetical protein DD671_15385 [Balneolaceae bacterium]|nr:hypothetical protein [Balneolaceae bacterium]